MQQGQVSPLSPLSNDDHVRVRRAVSSAILLTLSDEHEEQ